jgi:ABC-type nitrate/sulfonate/bicarbonate transport system substrate-binding protein
MKFKRLTIPVTTLFVAVSVITAANYGFNSTVKGKAAPKLKIIKTWSRKDCTDAPFIVAKRLGYFKQQGVDVVYTGETQPPQRIASILNGNNDVGSAHPNTLAIAREGGATVRGVVRSIVEPPASVKDIHLQHMWWVSNKNSDIKTIADIKKHKGKVKVGLLLRNACIDFLTDKLLAKYKIPKDKIEYITMPDVEQILALKKGLIDIATPHPPFYKTVEDSKIGNILITSRQIAGENAGTYLYYFTDKYIKNHKFEVKAFVKAIKKAERWINKNPVQANKWTAEDIGVKVSANHYYSDDSRIDDKQIKEWIDGSIESGALPKNTKIKVSDIITHEFDSFGNDKWSKTF